MLLCGAGLLAIAAWVVVPHQPQSAILTALLVAGVSFIAIGERDDR
jgi:ABC-type uncharacterized transport system permease subunit